MKLSDKLADYKSQHPFYTFEFFPPRTDQGFENLTSRISRLSTLDPLAISISWGAGGSTKDRSLELASLTQAEYGIETILHLTCTNMEKGMVDDALRAATECGIQNILALRGDPPRGEEYWIPTDPRFTHGIDLVSYIRSSREFSDKFCIGVAAYPDGHTDHDADEDGEIMHLKAKVDAGADFIVTQLFYDVDNFLRWMDKVRRKGINVPIIPGIMPIQTYSSFLRLTKLCGTRVPPSLASALETICHDDQKVKDFGVTLAVDMIRRLSADGGIRGVHLCTLNLEKSVQRILESLHWTLSVPHVQNQLIAETPGPIIHPPTPDSSLITTPSTATDSATRSFANQPAADGDGLGEWDNVATWDDFPNGRFGDYSSPAFGIQGPWGGPNISRTEAFTQYGHPTSVEDLTEIFLRYLRSDLTTTPFSPTPLSSESHMILRHLERLTSNGWWTVGSQPAVDGVGSSDKVVGWGPLGGYVYQKAFVEFFAERRDVESIVKRIEAEGNGWINYFAGNYKGEFQSNVAKEVKNPVTWGVFPGQEIACSTIIERESFFSWKDEAFSIWSEWSSSFRRDSQERKLLESVRDERWLMTIVHHDYKDSEALWSFLFSESNVR